MDLLERLDEVVARIRAASWKDRETLKEELLQLARTADYDVVTRHLENAKRTLSLEARWELDEVIEAIQPPPAPEPEPEPEPEEAPPADGRLRMSDLKEVYADPRGLLLYTDKSGKRWFASQPDPYTGQPMMMELPPGEIERVKLQLKGSPYWRLGSGVVP